MTKDEIHLQAVAAYLGCGTDAGGRLGAILKGTGVGKTKDGIVICRYFRDLIGPDVKILWLTNSTKLKTEDTPEDFEKWGEKELWDECITAECYQSAYKWVDTTWDLVVGDEFDFCLTPEYFKFFTNNTYTNLLGLTATVDRDKMPYLLEVATVCFKYSTQQAQADGVLNQSNFVLVEFELERVQKTIKVEYTKAGQKLHFMQTENEAYDYLDKQYLKAIRDKNKLERDMFKASVLGHDVTEFEKKIKWKTFSINQLVSRRKEFLWSLNSAKTVVHKILKKTLLGSGNEQNKALVFSTRTAQANKLCKSAYHGGKGNDPEAINKLNRGEIRAAAVVKAVNRGANLVGVNHIIKESYEGSSTDFQQQHGRGTRLEVNEFLTFWILKPYFYKSVPKKGKDGKVTIEKQRKPTQAVAWSIEMVKGFDLSNAKRITDKQI